MLLILQPLSLWMNITNPALPYQKCPPEPEHFVFILECPTDCQKNILTDTLSHHVPGSTMLENQVLPLFLPASFTYFKFSEAVQRQTSVIVLSERFVSIHDFQEVSSDQSFVLSEHSPLVREGLPFNTKGTLHHSSGDLRIWDNEDARKLKRIQVYSLLQGSNSIKLCKTRAERLCRLFLNLSHCSTTLFV